MSKTVIRLLWSCCLLILLASPLSAETGEQPKIEQLPLTVENLAGEWYHYAIKGNWPHITAWELSADGSFRGGIRDPGPYWQFEGTWELKDGEVQTRYTESSREMADMGHVDRDKILELTDQYMVLQNVFKEKTVIYMRGWNAALAAEAERKMKLQKKSDQAH